MCAFIPHGERLPKWEAPVSSRQAWSRVSHLLEEWVRKTTVTCYLVGKEFVWLKQKLPHGQFENGVHEATSGGMTQRTAQRLMRYSRECDQVERLLPYHPNPKIKNDTVSLLGPPEPDMKGKRPRKPEAEETWTEERAVAVIMEDIRKITQHCSIEELRSFNKELVKAMAEARRG